MPWGRKGRPRTRCGSAAVIVQVAAGTGPKTGAAAWSGRDLVDVAAGEGHRVVRRGYTVSARVACSMMAARSSRQAWR
jgi:hypothetical protein